MTNAYTPGLVSIITPAYKAADYVGETVDSVLAQGYENWEMLIVNDCSPDNTLDVIQELAKQDSRIKAMSNEVNSGPAMTRNTALSHAKGQYIAFLDSDDVWLPEKLELQLEFMRKNDSVFSFTEFRRFPEGGGDAGELKTVPDKLSYGDLLKNTAIATSSVLIDRSTTGDFRMTKAYYDDFVLWLELMKRGFTAHGLHRDLMRYRVVGGSVSRNKGKSAHEVWKTYREIENLSLVRSAWSFFHYAWNAYQKYRNF